ncbi:MAG: N-carbamoylputrescine amidase [Gammaproteobacteria bacterium]|nr:N-carbamoylputrescine amidase [Gammaproteobacteria bacterium]
MSSITVAATQMACRWDSDFNIDLAESLVREAHARGARLILLQELFATPYFCIDQNPDYFRLASPAEDNPLLIRMQGIARELGVVLPISFFERAGTAYFNSVAIIDAGALLGVYRKSHIPQGPGYQEKYYFTPGDTGFQVWRTRVGVIGVGICWDQWFPEAARAMTLLGADILLYPTAIGSEPQDPALDSQGHWQRTMQGHAAANVIPVIASNRIGTETGTSCALTFYGSSFIADATGAITAGANRLDQTVLTAEFDVDAIRQQRAAWGVFRDRRPDLYGSLSTQGAGR